MADQLRADQNLVFVFEIIDQGQRVDVPLTSIVVDRITAVGSDLAQLLSFDKSKLVISKEPENGLGEYTAFYDVDDYGRPLTASDKLRVSMTVTTANGTVPLLREFNVFEVHPTMVALAASLNPGNQINRPIYLQVFSPDLELTDLDLVPAPGLLPNAIVIALGGTIQAVERTSFTVTKVFGTIFQINFTQDLVSSVGDPINLINGGMLQIVLSLQSNEKRRFDVEARIAVEETVPSAVVSGVVSGIERADGPIQQLVAVKPDHKLVVSSDGHALIDVTATANALLSDPTVKIDATRINATLRENQLYAFQQTDRHGTSNPQMRYVPE